MVFHSYHKIPESLSKLKVDVADLRKLNKQQWVVTEKVHGANFSFTVDQDAIQYAKRKEQLTWEDDFFGFQIVAKKIEHSIRSVFNLTAGEFACDSCTIYGELFGGEYPHPAVPVDERVQAIQTGVYYAPSIEFFAFDIALNFKEKERRFLDYKDALRFFEQANLLHAEALFTGTLPEVMAYDINISSTIPAKLGLPELEGGNLIEGIVIKPLENVLLNTQKGLIRPIIKLKNKKFKEDKRFHQAKKWSYIPKEKREDIDFLLPDILDFLTENRLQNTISKIGQLDRDNKERIAAIKQLLLEDTLESFNEEFDGILDEMSEELSEILREKLMFHVEKMV